MQLGWWRSRAATKGLGKLTVEDVFSVSTLAFLGQPRKSASLVERHFAVREAFSALDLVPV